MFLHRQSGFVGLRNSQDEWRSNCVVLFLHIATFRCQPPGHPARTVKNNFQLCPMKYNNPAAAADSLSTATNKPSGGQRHLCHTSCVPGESTAPVATWLQEMLRLEFCDLGLFIRPAEIEPSSGSDAC